MKINVNMQPSRSATPQFYADNNKPILCQVDNYPADNPAYKKRDGFRCNDISLLDRLSFNMNVDDDLIKIISSRIKDFSKSEVKNQMSEEQMLKTLRPSWVQTPSEIKQYDEEVYQYLSTTDISKEQVDNLNAESFVVNDDVSVESKEVES